MSSGIFNKYTGYHNRRSHRLPGYDYSSPGYYFITICIHDKNRDLFGVVENGEMVLNEMGKIADRQIECLPERFPNIKIDAYIVMPNHVHAVIYASGTTLAVVPDDAMVSPNGVTANPITGLSTKNRAGASPAPAKNTKPAMNMKNTTNTKTTVNGEIISGDIKNITIGDILGAYKSVVSNECLKIFKLKNERMGKLWQRNYFERIVRNDKSLYYIRKYIHENPLKWSIERADHLKEEEKEENDHFSLSVKPVSTVNKTAKVLI